MSHQEPQQGQHQSDNGDGWADSIAAIAIITIVVTATVIWLHGL